MSLTFQKTMLCCRWRFWGPSVRIRVFENLSKTAFELFFYFRPVFLWEFRNWDKFKFLAKNRKFWYRFPDRFSDRLLDRLLDRFPDRLPDRFRDRFLDRFPDRFPGRFLDRLPDRFPDRFPKRFPGNIPKKVPGQLHGQIPGQIPWQIPGHIPSIKPFLCRHAKWHSAGFQIKLNKQPIQF